MWGLMELQKKIEKMHILRKGGEAYDFARAAVRDSLRPVHEGPALRAEQAQAQLKPAPISGVKRAPATDKPKPAPKPAAPAASHGAMLPGLIPPTGSTRAADGSTARIGSGFVTGGSGPEFGPFTGSMRFASPQGGWGSVIFLTRSMEDGHVGAASTVRVGFIGAD